MNDSLIRRFCESPYRWAIVATATVVLALATLWPAADDYFTKRSSRKHLSEEVVRAQDTAKTLPEFETRVAAVEGRLGALDARAVSEEGLPRYRSRLVEIVRESGCQIRRIDAGPPASRPWKIGGQALDEPGVAVKPGGPTPFVLERRSLTLAVDGPMEGIHNLLARLEKERTVAHTHRVTLQSQAGSGSTVTLELELWLFTLNRTAG